MSKITNLSKYVGWVLRDPDVTDGPMWLVAAGHKGRCTVIEVNTGIRFTDGCLQSVFQRSDRALLWRNIAPGSRLTIAGHDVTVTALNTDGKLPKMSVVVGPDLLHDLAVNATLGSKHGPQKVPAVTREPPSRAAVAILVGRFIVR